MNTIQLSPDDIRLLEEALMARQRELEKSPGTAHPDWRRCGGLAEHLSQSRHGGVLELHQTKQ